MSVPTILLLSAYFTKVAFAALWSSGATAPGAMAFNPSSLGGSPLTANAPPITLPTPLGAADDSTTTDAPFTAPNVRSQASETTTDSEPVTSPEPVTAPLTTDTNWTGERFPETRLGRLGEYDLSDWSSDKIRYAINEMYARHGMTSRERAINTQFEQFSWYHPDSAKTPETIEAEFDLDEAANMQTLAKARSTRSNSQ